MALRNRVAIITGASSGIGAATAQALGRAGVRLALFARRADRLEQIVEQVRLTGGQAIAIPGDARERASLETLIQRTLAEFGRIDVLFNNAGVGRLGWLERLDPADIRLQIEVNLLAMIETTQLALPHMIRQRSGHIVNMASLAGLIGTPTYSVYAATKFGVFGFNEALRREVSPWGIHVSGVYPGGVRTEWGEHIGYRRRSEIPFARRNRMSAEHVADTIVDLVKRPRPSLILPPFARALAFVNRIAPWTADFLTRRFVQSERRAELKRG
jgi:short-subunit dehydrogenase